MATKKTLKVVLKRADSGKLGSGRKDQYTGITVCWPRAGRRFVLKRTDSHKKRVFRTSPVKSSKKDGEGRVFKTVHGSTYRVCKAPA